MSASSIVPSTCECEARICSSSVDPARGRPTMKIGDGSSQPQPCRCSKNSRVQSSICLSHRPLQRVRPVTALRLLERVAARVEVERLLVLAAILVAPCRARNTGGSDPAAACGVRRPAHACVASSVVGEPVGLEVGEAPVGVAEVRAASRRLACTRCSASARCPGSSARARETGAVPGLPDAARSNSRYSAMASSVEPWPTRMLASVMRWRDCPVPRRSGFRSARGRPCAVHGDQRAGRSRGGPAR